MGLPVISSSLRCAYPPLTPGVSWPVVRAGNNRKQWVVIAVDPSEPYLMIQGV